MTDLLERVAWSIPRCADMTVEERRAFLRRATPEQWRVLMLVSRAHGDRAKLACLLAAGGPS